MTLVWNNEFDVNGQPNTTNWTYEYGFVRNRELQWYHPENAKCKDVCFVIRGKKEHIRNSHYNENSDNWRNSRPYAEYTSACLSTKNLHTWTSPGYFEIRARIDTSKGSWPAIWLLGTEKEWPSNGEIDIMEFYRIENEPSFLANVA